MHKSIEQIKSHHERGELHHAYLIEGDGEVFREDLLNLIEKILESPIHGNPDFWQHKTTLFGIDNSHELHTRQSRMAFGKRKCFLIEAGSFSVDAENALLKTLEDPTPFNHFFIIFRSKDLLLPTLLSRMYILEDESTLWNNEAAGFLASDVSERLKYIEKFFSKKTSSTEEKREIKRRFSVFLSDILKELHRRMPLDGKNYEVYTAFNKVKKYADDSGAASELVGEFVALALPMIDFNTNKSLL
ncbi:MAG: hypothetical protein HZA95_03130 [Candidatus Vogelbacteria bacterium]|nr:hypothetical protein [Candidatus Vogelbacteria bacterium]